MKQDLINKIQEIIGNQQVDESELLFKFKSILYEMELQNQSIKEPRSIADIVSENLSHLNENTNNGIIKTGFTELDQTFGGFSLGEFIVIGGRPSMGKTQLLINLALNISVVTPILYFTFDLSEYLLTNRFISTFTGISLERILRNRFADEHRYKLAAIGTNFSKYKIFINDSCKHSITAFKAQCEKAIKENGVKIIIVDYLQLMGSSKHRNNKEFEISYISNELKNIAKQFNVCVIASSQLSRAVESRISSKRPILSDLRDSGAIEQDADKVLFIYRPDYYEIECNEVGESTSGITELILAKNRTGSIGTINITRDSDFTNFRNLDDYKDDFSFFKSRLDEFETPF